MRVSDLNYLRRDSYHAVHAHDCVSVLVQKCVSGCVSLHVHVAAADAAW